MNIDQKEIIEFKQYLDFQEKTKHKKVKETYFKYHSEALDIINSKNGNNDVRKAEKLLLKALKLAAKNPYTQASACHELGVLYFSFHTKLSGGVYENLKKSVAYLTRAIESKERRSFPDRYVNSLSQLGVAYRRASMEMLWPESPLECLIKAENLHQKALNILLGFKFSLERLRQQPIIYCNLSSVQFDKKENKIACITMAKAFECFMSADKLKIPDIMSASQVLGLTYSRLNYFSEDKHHKEICDYILQICPYFGVDPLYIMGINPTADISNPRIEILTLVDAVDTENSSRALQNLRGKISNLMVSRMHTKTDQESDAVSVLIQLACSGLARDLVRRDFHLDALVELENVSAMRFCENANKYWQVPKQKDALILLKAQQHLGSTYYALNQLSLMLEQIDSEYNMRQYLSDSADHFERLYETENKLDESPLFNKQKYSGIVRKSGKEDNPHDFLQGLARVCLDDFKKLEKTIDKLDPKYEKIRKSDSAITSKHIEIALKKNPELTLVKIDIEDQYNDVLIIVASKQDEKIITNGFSFKLPNNLVNKIRNFITQENIETVQWELDFIDWKVILPLESRKVALLPSFFASQIPWNATGKNNEKLLNLVDEINWLPTILYLCNEVSYFDRRKGTLALLGGNTKFNQLAFKHQSHLAGSSDNKSIVNSISKADVFSYYGHCEHKYPERPSLLFQDYAIRDMELVDAVSGAQRIELWACQSGSNIPLHFLGSAVNEAFGMDMRMIEWGAKTSIGSLWAVPELVTAHIKNYYDKLISEGCNASQALLKAQRWWINEGADEELQKIKKVGVDKYLSSITSGEISHKNTIDLIMGPVLATAGKVDVGLDNICNSFKHPSAWAGMRFCGISEQDNIYIPRSNLTLNYEERNYMNRLVSDINLKSGFIRNGK